MPTTTTRMKTASTVVPPRTIHGAIESAVVLQQIQRQLPMAQRASTSSDDTSDDGHQSDKHAQQTPVDSTEKGNKKRKSTYYVRKDEMTQLQDEIEQLQHKLQRLEQHRPDRTSQSQLTESVDKNVALKQHVKQGRVAIATAQSLVSSYGPRYTSAPVGCFIRLPRCLRERQRTLSAFTMDKMREATQFVLARSQFLDLSRMSRQVDAFESTSGDYIAVHWEVTPLEDAPSVRRAFDELRYFTDTQEMTISEKLGVMTIRESDTDQADGAQNLRMLSQYENGITVESNVGVFTHYFERSELLDRPHALHIIDNIDDDALFPYLPQSRIRKDVSAVILITESPQSSTTTRPLVTMIHWAFIKLHHTECADKQDLEYVAREGVGKWCDIMLRCIRERLAWPGPERSRAAP